MGFPAIPEILKKSNWQTEKGKFAKLFAGETGIGAQMDKIKAAADKLDIGKLSVAQSYKSDEAVDQAITACKSEMIKCAAVSKECYALRDMAKTVAAKFKSNLLISKATATHVASIATAADTLGVAIKSYDPAKEFEAAKQKVATTAAMQEKILKEGFARCVTAVNSVKGGKATPDDWTKKAWQAIRGYSAAVAKSPELSTVHGEWKTLSSIGGEKLKDVAAVTKHVTAVDTLLKKTGPLVS